MLCVMYETKSELLINLSFTFNNVYCKETEQTIKLKTYTPNELLDKLEVFPVLSSFLLFLDLSGNIGTLKVAYGTIFQLFPVHDGIDQ
jgi:hypothetical protein